MLKGGNYLGEKDAFKFPVEGALLQSLQEEFPTEIVLGSGRADVIEYLVPQVREAKLEIFSKEHPPPHFRVSYGGESANYNLYTGERLPGNRPIGIKDRKVKAWWKKHRVAMAELWNKVRPSDCAVGVMQIPEEWRAGRQTRG